MKQKGSRIPTQLEALRKSGVYYFKNGKIEKSLELNKEDILIVEI
ncbi:hypothetical protein [Parvimonas micra]|nr:hypothetical protein [Parvimonas micra]